MASRNGFLIILGFILVTFAPAVQAADPEPGVARVSLVNGDVTRMRGDSGDWVALTVNSPVVGGDNVATGARSRTEIQLDFANILRLSEHTEARIADLSTGRVQVQLSQGVLNLTVLKGAEADLELNTPSVAVRPLKEGTYRVQVSPQGETQVIVRKGEAELYTSQGSTVVKKNQMVVVRGVDNPEYQVAKAPGRDTWDEWNEDRDDSLKNARSWSYANRYYTGAHDLDRYGRWVYVSGYDWVWSPSVASHWAPYRHGRWVWEPYWGWTWVSYEPWGWAPYHYGRWFHHSNAWYWWPGASHAYYRPVWAPAYVSFFGFGYGRFNFSFGLGWGYSRLGWLPVGPGDYYYPWHGRHRHSYHSVNVRNITNIRNVTNIYNIHNVRDAEAVAPLAGRGRPYKSNVHGALENPRMRDSITALGTDDFVNGRAGNHARRLEQRDLQDAQLVAGTPPAVPTRNSLRASDRTVEAPRTARTGRDERMFNRREPPKASHSFEQGSAALREMVQKPAASVPADRSRPGREASAPRNSLDRAQTDTAAPTAGRSSRPGVSTGRDQRTAPDRSQGVTESERGRDNSGWRRFGPERSESIGRTDQERPAERSRPNPTRTLPGGTNSTPPSGSEPNRNQDRTPGRVRQERAPAGNSMVPETRSGSGWQRFEGNRSNGRDSGAERNATPPRTLSPRRNEGSSPAPQPATRPAQSRTENRSSRAGSDSSSQFMSIPRSASRPEAAGSLTIGRSSRTPGSERFERAPRAPESSPRVQERERSNRTPAYRQAPRETPSYSRSAPERYENSRPAAPRSESYQRPRSDSQRYSSPGVSRAPREAAPSYQRSPSTSAPRESSAPSRSRGEGRSRR